MSATFDSKRTCTNQSKDQGRNDLHHRFKSPDFYSSTTESYSLAPYRHACIPGVDGKVLVVSEIGEFHFINDEDFLRLTTGHLSPSEPLYQDLRSKHFIIDSYGHAFRPYAAAQYRARKGFIFEGPALHIFVVTLRCDHSCGYCQVSRRSSDASRFDMSEETAKHAVDRLFDSPSRDLKVEFQGGESSIAFERVRQIVELVERRNAIEQRRIEFAMATTLTRVTKGQLEFCRDHRIHLSTSLDGPAELHDSNRPNPTRDSFARAVDGIRLAREVCGNDSVSALLTVTKASLVVPEEIIDTYVSLGFTSIFLRPLSHHGFARRSVRRLGYSTEEFINFFVRALNHLMKINLAGTYIEENYISLLMEHILTPHSTGYVDLRSPTGAGFGALVYNYDGHVYPSDEARMLAEIGDLDFRLGRVEDSYSALMHSPAMQRLIEHGVAESLPGCRDCVFVPYCGADPINYWAHHRALSGPAPESNFCTRQTFLFQYLFKALSEESTAVMKVLMSWWTKRPIVTYESLKEN